jgi:hypothetical protein
MMVSLPALGDFHFLPYEKHKYLSESDQNTIQLTNASSWTYCGPLLSLEADNLPQSYQTWHRATVKGRSFTPLLLSFLAYTHDFFATAGLSHYWVTIRATKTTPDFDTPRWHTDDDFFGREGEVHGNQTRWKLATSLLGPGTLFIEDGKSARLIEQNVKSRAQDEAPTHACASIRCLGCAATSDVVRSRLTEAFQKHRVVQAGDGECCFFRIGPHQGAVHSEPVHSSDRIFVNIVPGTEAELSGVMAKWGMEFPRAWSFGIPFQFSSEKD